MHHVSRTFDDLQQAARNAVPQLLGPSLEHDLVAVTRDDDHRQGQLLVALAQRDRARDHEGASIEVARICEGRSAMAGEYSAWNRAGTRAGENIAHFSSGICSQPSNGEMVQRSK